MTRHRSSAVPLAWLYTALIVYASLYPSSGWRVPSAGPFDYLVLGWPRWWTSFDLIANLLGYMPLGFLLFVAGIRSGRGAAAAVAMGCLGGTLLSFSMETLQNYLPQRVASNVDLGLNAAGTALGVAVGAALHWRGGIDRWQRLRERWFVARSAGGFALLVLWPIGLLFPSAVPFGLGHVASRLQPFLADLLRDTPVAAWSEGLAIVGPPAGESVPALSPATQFSIIVLGVIAPCLVAFTIAMPGWRRTLLVVGGAALGAATMTLSTALNFGPAHAFAWTTEQALQGFAVGTGVGLLLSLVPRRIAAGLGLIALTALVMLVAQAPADPYFAQSLQGWEQGRFIRFHGGAQWVGWLWPYAAMTYLLSRLAAREPRGTGF
ncbi:MAG: VanZ family protein [Caldimonas sp.]